MSVVRAGIENDELDPRALAERVFVEFSSEAQTLANGEEMSQVDQHYRLVLEGRDDYEFGFPATTPSVALFFDHAPAGLKPTLIDSNDVVQEPIAEHVFHSQHSHDSKVSSTSIELPGKFDGPQLNAWLEEFLQDNGPDVYRMKGVVGIAGQDYRFVFQGVHMIFGSQAAGEWGDQTPVNRLVFIGKNLDEPYIKQSLEGCLAA